MPDYPNIARQGLRDITELDTADWRWTQWLGADSTAMCVRPDGVILILCGDTYVNQTPDGYQLTAPPFTNNSLLWWKDGAFGVLYSQQYPLPQLNLFGAPLPYMNSFLSPAPGGFRWPSGAWVDDATDGLVHFMVSKNAGNIFAGYTPIAVEEWRIDNDLQILSAVDVPGLDPQTVGGEIVTCVL